MIAKARIVPAVQAEAARSVELLAASSQPKVAARGPRRPERARLVPKAAVAAAFDAAAIRERARLEAGALLEQAQANIAGLRQRAEIEARAQASAEFSTLMLGFASLEARADERGLERAVALARLLAERLLGESLRLAPEQITALARTALSEARGARKLTLVAAPEDARVLESSLASLGVEPEAVRIVADVERRRGSLRIETELGVLDGELAPQLDRLAQRLRESLVDGD